MGETLSVFFPFQLHAFENVLFWILKQLTSFFFFQTIELICQMEGISKIRLIKSFYFIVVRVKKKEVDSEVWV